MRKIVFALALAAAAATPTFAADLPTKGPAVAAPATVVANRWYIEGRLGFPLRQDYDINIGGGIGSGTYEPDTGWFGAVAVGVQWHPNWRAELAFSYATGSDGDVTLAGVVLPHRGDVSVYTFMLNGYYVFTNWGPAFQPFLGAGLGVALFDVNRLGAVGGGFVADGTDTTVAAALHVGADYFLTRSLALTGRYTLGYSGEVSVGSSPAGITTTRDGTFDHIFSAGFRWYLN
jgi:opacity protein-like surface antigen